MQNNDSTPPEPSIRNLFPELADDELGEAEDNLDRYIALSLRMYKRITADPSAYAQFKALTTSEERSTMKHKGRPNRKRSTPTGA